MGEGKAVMVGAGFTLWEPLSVLVDEKKKRLDEKLVVQKTA